MLDSPAGERMIDCARALPYDYAMVGDGLVPNELAAKAAIPTVVLADEAAPETARALVEIMPNAKLQKMKASAHDLPPTDIGRAVMPFFSSKSACK